MTTDQDDRSSATARGSANGPSLAALDAFAGRDVRLSRSVLHATAALRNLIVSGELQPGAHIGQGRLAERLGMSRIPVREALSVLANEGVLTHVEHSGYRVARVSRDEWDQIYFMRHALEDALVERLELPSTSELKQLVKLNDEFGRAAGSMDIAAMVRVNFTFHFRIYDLGGMPLVVEEIRRLWTRALPYQALHYYNRQAREDAFRDHQEMLERLRVGDLAGVVALMHSHRSASQRLVDDLLPADESAQ